MKKRHIVFIIIIISVLSIFPLLVKSNVLGHDTRFHLANIKDISNTMRLTNPLPKISNIIGNGLGYGTHLFYAPLPHYIGGYVNRIFRFLDFGADNCLVFMYLLVSISSGIIIYYLAFDLTKNKYTSLLSSIIYLLTPYRMGDMIVRSSYNEIFIFLFFPMILLSLNRLINNKKYLVLFVVSYSGLILSHLVMSLYATLFIIIWALFFYKQLFQKENILKLLRGISIVSMIVLPFLTLLVSQKMGGHYSVFTDGYMANIKDINASTLSLKSFIIPLNDYSWEVPQFTNILVIITFLISCFIIIKDKNKNKNLYYFIILFLINFIMCLKIFPWNLLPKFFYMIQFPWRLQTFIAVSLSIIAPICFTKLSIKKLKIATIIFTCLLIVTEIPFIKSMMNYTYLLDSDIDYNFGMGNSREYLPISANENLDYFNSKKREIKCDDCVYTITRNSSRFLKFEIETDHKQKIELPKIYYVGYELRDSNNKKIKFYENEFGLIEFIGNENTYTLTYKAPLMYRAIIILEGFVIIGIIIFKVWKRSSKN